MAISFGRFPKSEVDGTKCSGLADEHVLRTQVGRAAAHPRGDLMSHVDVVDVDSLDLDAFVDLQRKAFAELLVRQRVFGGYMTPAFYRWKYHTPGGLGRVAFIREGGRMVAANAMIPLDLRLGGRTVRAWQSCDTATRAEARRRGLFTTCIRALQSSLCRDEILYGFPNEDSARGLRSAGWLEKEVITTWVRVVLPFGRREPCRHGASEFGEDFDRFAECLARGERAIFDRKATWMNWRYVQHPAFKYKIFPLEDRGELRGFAVSHAIHVRGIDLVMLMELWGDEPWVERALVRRVVGWARQHHARALVLMDNARSLQGAARSVFLPVPPLILPKRQLLMVWAPPGGSAGSVLSFPWRIQSGDWDVF